MRYRKARSSDKEGIANVLKECYNIDSVKEGSEVFYLEINKGINYILAIDDGKVVGLVSWFFLGFPKHALA